jgi:hypothetical protein
MTATPTNNPLDEDTGEFACFLTLDALAAYLHHKFGEDFLRQALAPDPNPEPNELGIGPKENLENAAEKLEERGLDHVAAILRDLAKDAISGIDLPPDHWVNLGDRGIEIWRNKWQTRRKVESGELWRELKRKRPKDSANHR